MSNGYRRIYYDKQTKNKIAEVAFNGGFVPTTIEQDIANFTVLSERNRDTFDALEWGYKEFAQDFKEGIAIGVDVENNRPIFSYSNPNDPSNPIVPEKPLTEQIADIRTELKSTQDTLDYLLLG